jgi:Membrane transporters of cations and cationic drugs
MRVRSRRKWGIPLGVNLMTQVLWGIFTNRWDDPSAQPSHEDDLNKRGVLMSWLILFFAGLLETVWAVGLKYAEGFSRFWPSLMTLAAMATSLWLLSIALKALPLGTAYAIWTGIGAVGTFVVGIVLFGESMACLRLVSVVLIVAGMAGLKLFS